MADIVGYIPPMLLVDTDSGRRLINTEAQVFAMTDTEFSSPLPITDMQGVPFTGGVIMSNGDGVLPQFRPPAGVVQVIIRAGAAVTPVTDISLYAKVSVESAETASQAASAAQQDRSLAESASSAAVDAAARAEAVGATNDDINANLIGTKGTKTEAALSATIGEATQDFVTPSTVDDLVAVKVSETRVIKPVALSSDPDALREFPLVRKLGSDAAPLIPFSAQSAPSMYWPCLINLAQGGGEGYGLLYSTDHDTGLGGIYMMTAPTPMGPWTDKGLIYRDSSAGASQSETPSAFWNEGENLWFVFHQVILSAAASSTGVENQVTRLVTTPDFVNFTPAGTVLDKVPYTYGDGNATYFRVFTYGGSHYGYLLYGGTSQGAQTIAYSNDLRKWTVDPRLIGRSPDMLSHLAGFDPASFRLKFNGAIILEWRGNPWIIMTAGTSGAGAGAVSVNRIIAARLSPDLRRLVNRPVDITPEAQAWEGSTATASTGVGASLVTFQGRAYCLFRGVADKGQAAGFGLMEVY